MCSILIPDIVSYRTRMLIKGLIRSQGLELTTILACQNSKLETGMQLVFSVLTHRSDGCSSSVSTDACLCGFHHALLREGACTIAHAIGSEHHHNPKFEQHRHMDDADIFDFDRELTNDREPFKLRRVLLSTRYRCHFMNVQGIDVVAAQA